jgi:hypothetical protein
MNKVAIDTQNSRIIQIDLDDVKSVIVNKNTNGEIIGYTICFKNRKPLTVPATERNRNALERFLLMNQVIPQKPNSGTGHSPP